MLKTHGIHNIIGLQPLSTKKKKDKVKFPSGLKEINHCKKDKKILIIKKIVSCFLIPFFWYYFCRCIRNNELIETITMTMC